MKFEYAKFQSMKIQIMKLNVSQSDFANMHDMFRYFKLKEDRDA